MNVIGQKLVREIKPNIPKDQWEKDPIKPAVIKNKDLIQKLIGEALDEIRKE